MANAGVLPWNFQVLCVRVRVGMCVYTNLSNTIPCLAELLVRGQTGVHLCPTQPGEVVPQIVVNVSVHLLVRKAEETRHFY